MDGINNDRELLAKAGRTAFDDDPQWWTDFLVDVLRLPVCYYSVVKIALAESHWDRAAAPTRYLRSVAWRTANRLGMNDNDATYEGWRVSDQTHLWSGDSSISHDKALERLANEHYEDDGEPLSMLEFARGYSLDWEAILTDAGADEGIRAYVLARLFGHSRAEHGDTVRKRFLRLRPALERAVRREINRRAGFTLVGERSSS